MKLFMLRRLQFHFYLTWHVFFFGHRPNVFTGLNCNSDASWSTCALRCTSAGPSGTRTAAAEHLHDQLVKAAMDSMSARGDMSLSQNPFFFLGISGCYKTNSGPQPHKLKHDKQMIANLHQRCGNFLDRSFGMEVDLSRKHRLTEILQKWVSHKLWHTAHLDQNQQNWWFFRRKSCGRCCGRDVVHTPKYATIVATFFAPNCKGLNFPPKTMLCSSWMTCPWDLNRRKHNYTAFFPCLHGRPSCPGTLLLRWCTVKGGSPSDWSTTGDRANWNAAGAADRKEEEWGWIPRPFVHL